jgi:hypothetical protein
MSMKTYARIEDGLIAELLRTEDDITSLFHPALSWVEVSSQPDIAVGWHFDGTDFTPPSPPPPAAPGPTIAELQRQLAALSAQLAALSGTS